MLVMVLQSIFTKKQMQKYNFSSVGKTPFRFISDIFFSLLKNFIKK